MKLRILIQFGVLLLSTLIPFSTAFAQGTAFTYQGRLNDGANPANGAYDLLFSLFDANSGGTQLGSALTNSGVTVNNGLFTITLDFGTSVFSGADRWLEIGVRTNGGAFTTLSSRQKLTATPYAIRAANFSGAVSDSQLSPNIARLDANQTFSGTVNFNSGSNNYTGTFTGNGAGVTNVPGAIPLQNVAGPNVLAQPNTGYTATNSTLVSFSLPSSANVGDVVQVSGVGAGGWQVLLGAGQVINGSQTGAVWIARETNRNWNSVASSADGTKLVAVVSQQFGSQIYTSSDSGTSWIARDSNHPWYAVASSADGSKLVALAGQIYTSTDSGINWIARDSPRGWQSVASSADGSKLVAVVKFPSAGQIYTSTDSGTNWTARDSNRSWQSVASSADGSKLVAVEAAGQIYTSTDSGTNWTARENTRLWTSVASSADGSKLVTVVSGGQIYTSTDSGTNWIARESTRNWSSVASSADGSKLVAVAYGGQIYTSTDSGTNWAVRESNRYWYSVASSADGGKLVAVVNTGQIYTSIPSLSGAQGSAVELQYAGNGIWQSLGQLSAANISSGTLPDAQLSDNVALLHADQSFFGQNTFASALILQADPASPYPGEAIRILGTGLSPYVTNQAYMSFNDRRGSRIGYVGDGSTGDDDVFLDADYGDIAFITQAGRVVTVTSTGKVGIGTTTPFQLLTVSNAYCNGSTWVNASDRNAKKAFSNVNSLDVLDKVAALSVSEWQYKADADGIRHLGPTAQDFHAAFGLNGSDDQHIATVDEGGVALAAIQGLNERVQFASQKSEDRIRKLEAENADLKRRLQTENAELRRRLEALEKMIIGEKSN